MITYRLPFQGRWLGEAETERSQQICDNLSVTFGDSIPTPFVPSGHFPLIGGIGPWKGSLFLQLFPLLPAENRPGGQRGGKAGRPVRTSARSTRTFCTPQNKKRETVRIAAGSALVGGYFV